MCDDQMAPEPVAGALREYGKLLAEHGITWGEPEIFYVKLFAVRRVMPPELRDRFWALVFQRLTERHPGATAMELGDRLAEPDYHEVLRDTLDGRLPGAMAALRLTEDGPRLEGAPQAVLEPDGALPRLALLVDSSRAVPAVVEVEGRRREVPAGGAWLTEVALDGKLAVDGERVSLAGLGRTVPRSRVRLRAGFPCRWSVVGADGRGWFPEGVPHKHDYHGVPYFHGDDLLVDVPAEALTVTAARGMDYDQAQTAILPEAGVEHLVRLAPPRLRDPAADGWYGGDMHVHLNWAGDIVAAPELASAVQHGEDLHVLNLLAGNVSGARVYDREALEHWADADLPWSDAAHLARVGVEYRNDLLGHVYAFAPSAPPARFHTGFAGDADWPPNSVGLEELRGLGAVLGYSHPFSVDMTDDDPPDELFEVVARNCAAREIVADAALGLVDSLDVLNHSSISGTALIYRHLVGAGNRLAVTAGTDTMISFTRLDSQSSPPGWARVYAKVDGPLTARGFAQAVRRGRTFATTGPWLELAVNGQGPGAVIDTRPGDRIEITATVTGPEVSELRLRTADGVLLATGDGRASAEFVAGEPTYVLAEALGGPHPRTMTAESFAMTSPVYVNVAGRPVAREADVRFCLAWLDGLEELIKRHARLRTRRQLADHVDVLDRARAVYRERLG
ncbi:CehA/McbA family metallohydrolase [Nonomuraea sp. NPDC046570]|uniref:CehA/McbA family metallohydrolase n=1 Tax=Nonomuraea sp. NPDC046570 TaxID=3155255 RepID=UPI0033EB8041